jgi:hypothetical protein
VNKARTAALISRFWRDCHHGPRQTSNHGRKDALQFGLFLGMTGARCVGKNAANAM